MKHTPSPKQIVHTLNQARKAGSVQLTGSRDERKAQLRALREKDLAEEGRFVGHTTW
ncbi:hypothetical protein BvCmsOUNP043_01950 [Escherichia coli]|nr:hypothetical protein A31C_03737 [Escherichia coli KTE158]EQP90699.1 hypothetical protein G747_03009 [Escherichia coli HVH 85 (4-0792144)]EQV79020.1 hypothetical protein G891_03147 [Escherichia coli KOEGE 68 (182a)]GDS65980.1 hypothetical protein BvCmsOUNP043_01950 [Escherichia coli]